MDVQTFNMYLDCMEAIQAREVLFKFEASSFPKLKSDARSKKFKQYHKKAYPEFHEKKPLTSEQVAQFLSKRLS